MKKNLNQKDFESNSFSFKICEAGIMNEQKAFTIMMKDIEVMRGDFAALIYEVINEKYIPYPIKGKLQPLINLQI